MVVIEWHLNTHCALFECLCFKRYFGVPLMFIEGGMCHI